MTGKIYIRQLTRSKNGHWYWRMLRGIVYVSCNHRKELYNKLIKAYHIDNVVTVLEVAPHFNDR